MAATQKGQQHVQDTSEEDLSQLDERELDAEFAGEFLNVLILGITVLLFRRQWFILLFTSFLLVMIDFPNIYTKAPAECISSFTSKAVDIR